MNALVRSTYAAVTFAAVVLLASCGGGSGSTLGSTELPNVQSAVLPAANATSDLPDAVVPTSTTGPRAESCRAVSGC